MARLLEIQRELCRNNFYWLELLSDLRVGIRDRYSNEHRRHTFPVVPYGVTGRDVTNWYQSAGLGDSLTVGYGGYKYKV